MNLQLKKKLWQLCHLEPKVYYDEKRNLKEKVFSFWWLKEVFNWFRKATVEETNAKFI